MQQIIRELDRQEILRYLGWRGGELSPQMDGLLTRCIQSTLEIIRPNYRYQCFPITSTPEGIQVEHTGLLLTGSSIVRHLEGCHSRSGAGQLRLGGGGSGGRAGGPGDPKTGCR